MTSVRDLCDPAYHARSKREAFSLGLYSFPAPPVCHAAWTTDDWIRYIDSHGKWHTEVM